MKDVKIVFLQAEREDFHKLSKLLCSIKQTEFFFLLVPDSVKVLSKKEVLSMLSACPDQQVSG